jgi:hypothetical protein
MGATIPGPRRRASARVGPAALRRLQTAYVPAWGALGLGQPLVLAMKRALPGLRAFSRPITGGYYWCPPVANNRLDLSAVGS